MFNQLLNLLERYYVYLHLWISSLQNLCSCKVRFEGPQPPSHAATYIISCLTSCFVSLQALSAIFFLSFVVQILYYYGIMQLVVIKLGQLIQVLMGTTVCESVNAAASVFLGMVIRRCTLCHEEICTKQD